MHKKNKHNTNLLLRFILISQVVTERMNYHYEEKVIREKENHDERIKSFLLEVDVKDKTIQEIYKTYRQWHCDNYVGYLATYRLFKEIYAKAQTC